jgi:predicted nucleic acid-binding protein
LLDTSFLIRLLNKADTLHARAKEYFRYFLEQGIALKCSTISISEYCVKGKCAELPLRNLQIIPFNFNHAVRAGELMAILRARKATPAGAERAVVINDIKLFAQADIDFSEQY